MSSNVTTIASRRIYLSAMREFQRNLRHYMDRDGYSAIQVAHTLRRPTGKPSINGLRASIAARAARSLSMNAR